MDKNNISTILMMVAMGVLMMFGFRMCQNESGDNFGYLNYSKKGLLVEQQSISDYESGTVSGETDLVQFAFDLSGAVLSSYKIKSQHESDDAVELILPNKAGDKPFSIYWGNDRLNPVRDNFKFTDISTERSIVYLFTADFLDNNGKPFTLEKKYVLLNDSYMFKMSVRFITADNMIPEIGKEGYSYSVYYGPQLGPEYSNLSKKDARYGEERLIHESFHDKKNKQKHSILMRSEVISGTSITNDGIQFYRDMMKERRIDWVALSGKYFIMIAEIPSNVNHLFYATDSVDESESGFNMVYENEFFLTHFSFEDYDDLETDYSFYMGPRSTDSLRDAANAFGRKDLDFDVLSKKGFLGLSTLVKKAISFINYGVNDTGIGNWGWSIVIFTIILKVLLFGLTRKSYESTSKMQKISPMINDLKEKYKDKPQEMNAAMAELYKKEGVNPMMGCLPMLLQFPILIAIYTFINNSYELRSQPFFGWITDLSSQDALISFGTEIPVLNWTSLNLLPILYILTQMVSTKLMQPGKSEKGDHSPAGAQQMQMKLMQYGLPLMFFFILYRAPSGLFVYWITMNIVTAVQQVLYNKFYKGKEKPKMGLLKKAAKNRTKKA